MEMLRFGKENYFVTENDEMAARGRIVTEYADLRKRLVSLQNEARLIGEKLYSLGQPLQGGVLVKPGGDLAWLDRDKIQSLLNDLWETNQKVNELRLKVKELGIDI
jgi:hypothetical protein